MKKYLYLLYVMVFVCLLSLLYLAKTDKSYNSIASQFEVINVQKLENIFTQHKSANIMLGKESCSYCKESMEVIDSLSKKDKKTILYLDMENISSDTKDYAILKEMLKEACIEDKLYVPLLINIKDGRLHKFHIGTFTEHKGGKLSKEQKQRLKGIFMECLEV